MKSWWRKENRKEEKEKKKRKSKSHRTHRDLMLVILCVKSGDTTPTCTRADAHFSRAHLTVHIKYSTALCQCGHSALAQGEKVFVSRIRLHQFPSRLTCHF